MSPALGQRKWLSSGVDESWTDYESDLSWHGTLHGEIHDEVS